MPEEANTVANWPKRFTQPYVEWCRGAAVEGSSCCVDVLYTQPKIENLNQLRDLPLPWLWQEGPYLEQP